MNSMPYSKPGKITSKGNLSTPVRPTSLLRQAPRCWLLLLTLLLAGVSLGLAQSPSAINYQGTLTDNVGKPLPFGVYQIQFKIWNSAGSPDPANYIWGRSFPVNVASNGMFNVVIDDGGGVIGSPKTNYLKDAFGDSERWLGLSIAATPTGSVTVTNEISPRQKLVSAPYALHSSEANKAANADRATYALTATNAINANNATNFGNMTTNDFLWVKKSSQGISGSLTITNSLTVQGTFTNSGAATFSNDVLVNGSSTFSGAVNANRGINVPSGNAITVASGPLIEIRSYKLADIGNSNNNGVANTNTGYSTAMWSAAIIGWQCHANVEAANDGLYRFRAVTNISGSWSVELAIFHDATDVHEIYVDAMFIRKELVRDYR